MRRSWRREMKRWVEPLLFHSDQRDVDTQPLTSLLNTHSQQIFTYLFRSKMRVMKTMTMRETWTLTLVLFSPSVISFLLQSCLFWYFVLYFLAFGKKILTLHFFYLTGYIGIFQQWHKVKRISCKGQPSSTSQIDWFVQPARWAEVEEVSAALVSERWWLNLSVLSLSLLDSPPLQA